MASTGGVETLSIAFVFSKRRHEATAKSLLGHGEIKLCCYKDQEGRRHGVPVRTVGQKVG